MRRAADPGSENPADAHVKPSHAVSIDSPLSVRKQGLLWTILVTGLSDKRGGAADAALLYRETEASMAARAEELARRAASAATEPKLSARPTKRDRRRLRCRA